MPVGEESWLVLTNGIQPLPRPDWFAPQSFELLHGPSKEVLVDAQCQVVQLGAIESSVIVDPASDLGVDFLSEAEQIRATATVEVPGSDLLADRLLRLGADSRREAHEQASRALGQAAPEGIAQEVEAGVLRVSSWATRVFAVRDLRLLGVQLETKGREPVGDQVPKGPGLSLSVAVDNDVVRLCRAPDYAACRPKTFCVEGFPVVSRGIIRLVLAMFIGCRGRPGRHRAGGIGPGACRVG
jgi:hypothetical protein